jgi:hypothetical protein
VLPGGHRGNDGRSDLSGARPGIAGSGAAGVDLALIAGDLADEREQPPNGPKYRLTELRGLGKEIWEGIDAQEYVNQLRDEWDERTP